MPRTVKARGHHGAHSLDITIPTEIVRKYELNVGDIFELTVDKSQNEITLIYKKVYAATHKIS